MKMIIVLDKICLLGIISASLYVGYKVGVTVTEVKHAKDKILKVNFNSEE